MPLFGPPNIDKMISKRDIDGLIKVLKNKDRDLLIPAINALGELGDSRAVVPLVNLIGTAERAGYTDFEKDALCRALGKLRDRRAVGPLVRMYFYAISGSPGQKMALQALVSINPNWGKLPEAKSAVLDLYSNKGTWLGNYGNIMFLLAAVEEPRALRDVAQVSAAAEERKKRTEGLRGNDD